MNHDGRRPRRPRGPGRVSPTRVAMYYRVSGKEQLDGYSLDAQIRAIETHCRTQGWEIVARYPEPAKSARTDNEAKRPAFQHMLDDAEAGRFDVVVVHKLDRFARNRRVAFDAFHRLGKAGVGFVSIAENMDYSTPAGQLMLTMLVGMAQFYSDNLSFETKKGKGERKAQGLPNGLLPFGVRLGASGLPVLDHEAKWCDVATRTEIIPAQGLESAFELAAAGKTDREIAQALTAAGYRTSGNRGRNPFTKDTVRVILQNRFYLGELPDGEGGWVAGKHGSLIDPAIFERAAAARAANTRRPRRTAGPGAPWALSGLAVCGTCGGHMVANSRPGGRRSIRCYGRIQGTGCDEPSFYEDVVDEQVGAILDRFALPKEDQERLLDLWRGLQATAPNTDAEKTRLRRKLDRLRDLYLEGDVDKASYQEQKAELTSRLAVLPASDRADDVIGRQLAAFLADMSGAWKLGNSEERNKLARQIFGEAIVENRTVVAVKPRPDLAPFFSAVKWCEGGSDGGRLRRFRTRTSSFHPMRSGWGNGVWSWIGTARLVEGSSPSGSRRPRVLP
ncbi:MAG: recombinase family protein [Chloroflexota bacterium]|nr:recombinase family protein [Chloroflexota bacterium]